MNRHRDEFKCTLCPKRNGDATELRSHMRTHSEGKFKCVTCGSFFKKNSDLRRHEETHLAKSDRISFPCSICKKSFTSLPSMKVHFNRDHKNAVTKPKRKQRVSKKRLSANDSNDDSNDTIASRDCNYQVNEKHKRRRMSTKESAMIKQEGAVATIQNAYFESLRIKQLQQDDLDAAALRNQMYLEQQLNNKVNQVAKLEEQLNQTKIQEASRMTSLKVAVQSEMNRLKEMEDAARAAARAAVYAFRGTF